MKKLFTVFCQFNVLSQWPTMFQTTLLVSPAWLLESNGTKRGLVNQHQKDATTLDYSVGVLDDTALGLYIVAAVLLWLHEIAFITTATLIWTGCTRGRRCLRATLAIFYLSFFMLAGCIRFGSIFPMEKISDAFFCSIATFCYIWLVVLIFICDHICKNKREEHVFHTLLCGLRQHIDEF